MVSELHWLPHFRGQSKDFIKLGVRSFIQGNGVWKSIYATKDIFVMFFQCSVSKIANKRGIGWLLDPLLNLPVHLNFQ